jgi:prevent-host-death family protein
MHKATVSEIKNRLGAYLKKVRAGETILVLYRNRPVARIEPVTPRDDPGGALAMLAREGIVRPGSGLVPLDALKTAAVPGRGVLKALIKQRRSGR